MAKNIKMKRLNTGGNILSGAVSGAGIGSTFGPIGAGIGAGVGAITGFVGDLFGRNKAKEENEERMRAREEALATIRESNDSYAFSNFNPLGNQNVQGFYACGGKIKRYAHGGTVADYEKVGSHTMPDGTIHPYPSHEEYMKHKNLQFGGATHRMPDGTIMPGVTHADYIRMTTDGNTKQIGDGVQVTTSKKGTDTINANVEGANVKLDDGEIIIKDSQGNPVVLSDDLGDAGKYRNFINSNPNPIELNAVTNNFAEEAKLKGKSGDSLQFGGIPNTIPLRGNTRINKNPISNRIPNRANLTNIDNKNVIPTYGDMFGKAEYYIKALRSIDMSTDPSFGHINPRTAAAKDTAKDTARDTVNGGINFGDIANIGLGAFNIFSNTQAAARLEGTEFPDPILSRFQTLNPRVNAPIFSGQRNRITSGFRNVGDQITSNVSSSNVGRAQLAGLKANELNAISGVNQEELANIGQIQNLNTQGINRTSLSNVNIVNQGARDKYQDELGRINTQLALTGSTIDTAQGFLDNQAYSKYQDQLLNTIAETSTGIARLPNETDVQYKARVLREKLKLSSLAFGN